MFHCLKENKIEARQFIGDSEKIGTLLGWLKSKGLTALLQTINRSPRVKVTDSHGNTGTIAPTEWIIQLPNGRYNVWTDAAFRTHFKRFEEEPTNTPKEQESDSNEEALSSYED
jgi:hypothetical protein